MDHQSLTFGNLNGTEPDATGGSVDEAPLKEGQRLKWKDNGVRSDRSSSSSSSSSSSTTAQLSCLTSSGFITGGDIRGLRGGGEEGGKCVRESHGRAGEPLVDALCESPPSSDKRAACRVPFLWLTLL